MKAFKVIAKIVVALAAIAGIVYVIATYGDRIVAWARKLINRYTCCCDCECDCDECDCEDDCEDDEGLSLDGSVAGESTGDGEEHRCDEHVDGNCTEAVKSTSPGVCHCCDGDDATEESDSDSCNHFFGHCGHLLHFLSF